MYEYPRFHVEIMRDVSSHAVSWPEPRAAEDDSGLGGNREYMDLRGLSWSEAVRVSRLEGDLIARIESATDPKDEYDKMEEQWYEHSPGLYGLDLGVASSVVALSAARTLPFSSCNAGVFGGRHYERHPLVAFFARPQMLGLLLECAVTSEIGLVVVKTGELVAYATDVRQMRAFASALISRRADFRAIRGSRARRTRSKSDKAAQQELFAPEDMGSDSGKDAARMNPRQLSGRQNSSPQPKLGIRRTDR